MKLDILISQIRTSIKEFADDTEYNDRYLWQAYCTSRANVFSSIPRQNQSIHENMYLPIVLEMEEYFSHGIECLKDGCKVYLSKNTLPDIINAGRFSGTLKISLADGKRVSLVPYDIIENWVTHPLNKKAPLAFLFNKKLGIANWQGKEVIARAVWFDVVEAVNKSYCGDKPKCLSLDDVHIDVDFNALVLKDMKRDILTTIITNDTTNDVNNQIRQP